ncbi:MAG: hypothetical protein Q8N17_04905 [Burkholderiaceae bacterium]|nr:hypothetical protein [Burkholderiaceae bacterium]
MNVLVLLAGIADTKWPLPGELSAASLGAHRAGHEALGPFDETALELALKLRDATPDTRITVLLIGEESLARKVAGYRIDHTLRLDAASLAAWSPADCSASLRVLLQAHDCAPDLVLLGREFGDQDDGSIPVFLAQAMTLPHFSLTLSVQATSTGIRVLRQGASGLERVDASTPALLSVTNDSHNRLRQPLLKNVMASKKMNFPPCAIQPTTPAIEWLGVQAAAAPTRTAACRLLQGTPDEQARALADVLVALGEAP